MKNIIFAFLLFFSTLVQAEPKIAVVDCSNGLPPGTNPPSYLLNTDRLKENLIRHFELNNFERVLWMREHRQRAMTKAWDFEVVKARALAWIREPNSIVEANSRAASLTASTSRPATAAELASVGTIYRFFLKEEIFRYLAAKMDKLGRVRQRAVFQDDNSSYCWTLVLQENKFHEFLKLDADKPLQVCQSLVPTRSHSAHLCITQKSGMVRTTLHLPGGLEHLVAEDGGNK